MKGYASYEYEKRNFEDNRFGKIDILVNREQSGEEDCIFCKTKECINEHELSIAEEKSNLRLKLSNQYILKMVSAEVEPSSLTIRTFFEYPAENLSLRKELLQSPAEQLRFLHDLLQALTFLEKNQMVHGNLRPEYIHFRVKDNIYILLDRLNDVAPPIHSQFNSIRFQHKLFLPPKLFNELVVKNLSVTHNPFKTDVFCLGMVLLSTLFDNDEKFQKIYNFHDKIFDEEAFLEVQKKVTEKYFSVGSSIELGEILMKGMLSIESKKRLTPISTLTYLQKFINKLIEQTKLAKVPTGEPKSLANVDIEYTKKTTTLTPPSCDELIEVNLSPDENGNSSKYQSGLNAKNKADNVESDMQYLSNSKQLKVKKGSLTQVGILSEKEKIGDPPTKNIEILTLPKESLEKQMRNDFSPSQEPTSDRMARIIVDKSGSAKKVNLDFLEDQGDNPLLNYLKNDDMKDFNQSDKVILTKLDEVQYENPEIIKNANPSQNQRYMFQEEPIHQSEKKLSSEQSDKALDFNDHDEKKVTTSYEVINLVDQTHESKAYSDNIRPIKKPKSGFTHDMMFQDKAFLKTEKEKLFPTKDSSKEQSVDNAFEAQKMNDSKILDVVKDILNDILNATMILHNKNFSFKNLSMAEFKNYFSHRNNPGTNYNSNKSETMKQPPEQRKLQENLFELENQLIFDSKESTEYVYKKAQAIPNQNSKNFLNENQDQKLVLIETFQSFAESSSKDPNPVSPPNFEQVSTKLNEFPMVQTYKSEPMNGDKLVSQSENFKSFMDPNPKNFEIQLINPESKSNLSSFDLNDPQNSTKKEKENSLSLLGSGGIIIQNSNSESQTDNLKTPEICSPDPMNNAVFSAHSFTPLEILINPFSNLVESKNNSLQISPQMSQKANPTENKKPASRNSQDQFTQTQNEPGQNSSGLRKSKGVLKIESGTLTETIYFFPDEHGEHFKSKGTQTDFPEIESEKKIEISGEVVPPKVFLCPRHRKKRVEPPALPISDPFVHTCKKQSLHPKEITQPPRTLYSSGGTDPLISIETDMHHATSRHDGQFSIPAISGIQVASTFLISDDKINVVEAAKYYSSVTQQVEGNHLKQPVISIIKSPAFSNGTIEPEGIRTPSKNPENELDGSKFSRTRLYSPTPNALPSKKVPLSPSTWNNYKFDRVSMSTLSNSKASQL